METKERDKIRAAAEKLHLYLMSNTGTIYVCKKCGREDFFESLDSGGSDSGICCPDCGNEEFHEYDLCEYHATIIALLDALDSAEKENARLREALKNTTKCNTKNCDEVISTSYCTKCRRDWES